MNRQYFKVYKDNRVIGVLNRSSAGEPIDTEDCRYIASNADASVVYNTDTVFIWNGTDFVDTGQPKEQPLYHYWDKATNVWVDMRTLAEKTAHTLTELRTLRNARLAECDWTQVPDAPVDAEAWRVYRQQLRDLPGQYPDILSIDEVVWPNPPS